MWKHSKYKAQFKGTYTFLKGERVFNLVSDKRTITFESWQAAKSAGWEKV